MIKKGICEVSLAQVSVTKPFSVSHNRTCKRAWTVGGNLRNIPFGGKNRNSKQTKASSSRSGNPRTQAPQPPLPLGEEPLQNSQYPTPMEAMVPQGVSHLGSYYSHDEISCLDAIQFLIQPQVINQHVNAENQFGIDRADVALPQEWNFQSMASQQALPQQTPRQNESNQTPNQTNSAAPNHLSNNSSVQPNWSMNSLPQDVMNNFSFPTSNACSWNNSFSNATNMEMDTTSVDVDQWLNFSDHGSP
ncbi:hypothetical protein BUALT_Bualt04G0135300 [Buddleja alternifolia]|uniref:Dof-type domain-containing protein n=1 Tax=Buddleja alternifolia TaxID=168488 RepID=A0AAV6XNN0_9LAMI|nr:hypothetical protein BUALT_Bualt04G0135300 [Buddleja alternifolia]